MRILTTELSTQTGPAPTAVNPGFLSRWPARIASRFRRLVDLPLRRSRYTNLYHCTTQRAGSQWIKQIFADPLVRRFSGLATWDYEAHLPGGIDPRPICERIISTPFPFRTVATPLYIGYEAFRALPQTGPARSFFVLRDPRDLVVSEYFSTIGSHPPMGDLARLRERLQAVDQPAGMRLILDDLAAYGTFACQKSWIDASADPDVLLVHFEDLIAESGESAWQRVLEHFDIRIPRLLLRQVLKKYAFSRLAGRQRGVEDKTSHYRKGVHGDWKNYFDASLRERFHEITGNLVQTLGYEN